MEDSNIWYYLVLGLIYFISKAFGKKKQKKRPGIPVPSDSGNQPTEDNQLPDLSFEDILKELTGQKRPVAKPVPAPMPEPQIVQPVVQPAASIHTPSYSSDEMDSIASAPLQSTYSEGFAEAEEKHRRASDTFKRNTKYAIKEIEGVDYAEILQEQNGAAKAFVMHEIFNRKY